MNNVLKEYDNYQFEYEGETNPIYKSFQTKYKNYLQKMLPENYVLQSFNKGYYYFSGIIKSDTDDLIYLSIPDVRDKPNNWKDSILISQMEYTNGIWKSKQNFFTNIDYLRKDLQDLNNKGYINNHSKSRDYYM